MMRKVLISLAVAASALAVVAPASAQYYPQQQPGYGYGNNNYGQVRRLQVRIDQIQRQIERLDQRRILSNREARDLRDESRSVERRLRDASRRGLNPREGYDIERRIARLEQHVRYEANDRNRSARNGYNGYDGQYAYDRDRDGRDDRYEDDRGTRHD
jgi:TolA-binding protein